MWRVVEGCGGVWRVVECCGGLWRGVEGCGGLWRVVEGCGGLWRVVEGCGGENPRPVLQMCMPFGLQTFPVVAEEHTGDTQGT